jgi:hypothetical protein
VAVCGDYAIVVVNTSEDFVNSSGIWHAIRIADQTVVRTESLPGQPDSIAVSPDCQRAAIAIENERDEDINDGAIPQLPPGSLTTINLSSMDPSAWTQASVDLTGLDGVLYPDDPEPEYVSINADNIAVVTLQENNGIVLVDLLTNEIIASYSAGSVDLDMIDTIEDGIIYQNSSLADVPREPDGVAWIGTEYFATADEGDLDGRGFTIYNKMGDVISASGNSLEWAVARAGHYPDARSEAKETNQKMLRLAFMMVSPWSLSCQSVHLLSSFMM